jgi:hypothetical protein
VSGSVLLKVGVVYLVDYLASWAAPSNRRDHTGSLSSSSGMNLWLQKRVKPLEDLGSQLLLHWMHQERRRAHAVPELRRSLVYKETSNGGCETLSVWLVDWCFSHCQLVEASRRLLMSSERKMHLWLEKNEPLRLSALRKPLHCR